MSVPLICYEALYGHVSTYIPEHLYLLKKKNNPKHKIVFKEIPYSPSFPGEDNLYPPAGKRKQRELPLGAGGNVSGGRNTEIGKDSKDGYASAVRLAEPGVCQKLIHKQMLIL